MQIEKILENTNIRKGAFQLRASISQQIKSSMRWQPNWDNLSDDKKEALEMIADRISIILNGNADNKKTWYSIAGYAKLAGDSSNESNDNDGILVE